MIRVLKSGTQGEASFVRIVTIVGAILASLTVIEYILAVELDHRVTLVSLLSAIAVAKAVMILWFFMHLPKLWHMEEH